MEVPNKSQTQFHLHHYGTTIFKNALNENLHLPGHQGKVRIQALPISWCLGYPGWLGSACFMPQQICEANLQPGTKGVWIKLMLWQHFGYVEKQECWEQATSSFKYCSCLGLTFRCEIWRPQRAENVPIWPLGCSSPKSNPKCCDLFGWVVDEFHDYPAIAPPKPPSTSLISENHLSITESFDTQKVLGKGLLIKHTVLSLNLTQDCSL